MNSEIEIHPALKRYWGYEAFRPLQERIVRSLLGGRDACVVMPTGGGKSLCYQLPAALLDRQTVIVISPLIALMQDQVAQLGQMGIPAALLNSSLTGSEQSTILRKAQQGAYRLLYLSPERIARGDTTEWLARLPISFFAIDEAHCISEWGHEFRPDYRQLSSLRKHFPDKAIAAFTASATRQVRHDIIGQLQLRDPDKYIASFHRSNLRYVVKECNSSSQNDLLVTALKKYAGSNVIVYAPTISRVEETVDFLESLGIAAIAYHGKMDGEERRRNQERWMSDEVPVLVGTIAFGLGINKAAVRAVIHLSLPKSIEQYYQEAGRGGRDGLPADCILLWQKRDIGLLTYFIEQLSDPLEKKRAWDRYHIIRRFVETAQCRHHQICQHFGEIPKWKICGACDVCIGAPDWLSLPAMPKRRKKKKKEYIAAPVNIAEELGTVGKPGASKQSHAAVPPSMYARPERESNLDPHHELREYLREWRRGIAKEQGVATFIVMLDVTMDELCKKRPDTLAKLLRISGIGERKVELYGRQILEALNSFDAGARAAEPEKKSVKPAEETMRLLGEGRSFAEIAQVRGRQMASVVDLVIQLMERGDVEFQENWVDGEKRKKIEGACETWGMKTLKPLKEALPAEITYEEIKLVIAQLRIERQESQAK